MAFNKMLKRCLSSSSTVSKVIKAPEKLAYPSLAAHHFIMEGVEQNAGNTIAIDAMTKQEVTGAEFLASLGRMANKFKSHGVTQGDHVAIVGLNHLNYLTAKLGLVAIGAVPVLFNPLHNAQEFEKLVKLSECKYAIGHMCSNSQLTALSEKMNLKLLPQLEFLEEWAKDERSLCPEFPGQVEDTCLMMFSSGTTGLPKSVELTHNNLNSQLACLNISTRLEQIAPPDLDPVTVDFLPEFHTYGSIMTHYITYKGFKRVMIPMFTPEIYLQAIQDYKANGTTLVPPIMHMLAKLPIVSNYDLSSLRLIVVGAAPLPPEAEEAAYKRLLECNPTMELRICQGYGATETSGVTMFSRFDDEYKPGTVGKVVAGQEVKLVNTETGQECGPNERGQVFIRGPQIMKGYYKNKDANAEAFENEWLVSGDIAYYDDDGDFFIVDRLKEFIKVKAFQVAPAELESILITHKDITEAAVIGIPHERHGEVPKAYIIKNYESNLTEKDVMNYVASQVSDYKQVRVVEFVRSIPKLPSGKIQRRLLREKHQNDHGEQASSV